jgi:uncharacterized small protein (DUF1192 family)
MPTPEPVMRLPRRSDARATRCVRPPPRPRGSAALGDSVTDLAGRLATLRGEVESLSAELAQKEADLRDQLRSLARQKADLELDAKKEQTRLQKTRLTIDQKKKVIETEQAADQALVPTFEGALERVRRHVRASLPFRTAERLAELDKIEDQYKSGLLTPQRGLARLWAFVEDEFRLTRESGIYRQVVTLDGKEQLADVVRVGTVMLYFKTGDETVGYARKAGDAWEYVALPDKDARRRIDGLFDSLKKQIRVGYFELPNALPAGGGS